MSLGSMRDACLCSIAKDDGIHLHNRKQCLDAAQENYGDDDSCVDRFIEEERKANGDDQDKNQWAFELCASSVSVSAFLDLFSRFGP